jgi:Domain of unknown function (DUF4386)
VPAETEERAPLFYARVAGFIYLFAMALSILSQMLIPDRIVVSGDAAATARNVVSFGGTFRLGIAIDVLIFASDVVIAWAFYELLKSVDRSLALLGAFLRVADGAILAVTAFSGLITLRLLSGADYLQSIPMNQLQGLARLFISVRGAESTRWLGDLRIADAGDRLARRHSLALVRRQRRDGLHGADVLLRGAARPVVPHQRGRGAGTEAGPRRRITHSRALPRFITRSPADILAGGGGSSPASSQLAFA